MISESREGRKYPDKLPLWWLVAISHYFFCENSGSLAMLAAIRRASSV